MKFLRHLLTFLQFTLFFGVIAYAVFYVIDNHFHPERYQKFQFGPFGSYSLLVLIAGIVIVLLIAFAILKAILRVKMQEKGISNLSKKEIANGILWKARKRNALGLPWTLTVFLLDQDRLYIRTGLLNTTEDEVRLYRITDVTMNRSFWQRIVGMGTLHCDSSDQTMSNFDIPNIKSPKSVKTMLSKLVDASRIRNKVLATESVGHVKPHDLEGHEGHEHPGDQPPIGPEIDRADFDGNGIPDALEK